MHCNLLDKRDCLVRLQLGFTLLCTIETIVKLLNPGGESVSLLVFLAFSVAQYHKIYYPYETPTKVVVRTLFTLVPLSPECNCNW